MDLNPIGVPVSRHEGRLQGKGILGEKALRINDHASFTQAHFAVLQQLIVAVPYVDMHKSLLRRNYPLKSEVWIAREHRDTFGGWFVRHFMENKKVCPSLRALAQ